ncbi:MAG: hypothetical protein AAFN76_06110 [Pseudomonadota bacterium]
MPVTHGLSFRGDRADGQAKLIKAAIIAVFLGMGDQDQLAVIHFARIVFETGIVLIFADLFAVCVELNLAPIFFISGTTKRAGIACANGFQFLVDRADRVAACKDVDIDLFRGVILDRKARGCLSLHREGQARSDGGQKDGEGTKKHGVVSQVSGNRGRSLGVQLAVQFVCDADCPAIVDDDRFVRDGRSAAVFFFAFANLFIVRENLDLAEVHALPLASHRFCFSFRDFLGFRLGHAVRIIAIIDLDFEPFPALILNFEPRAGSGIHGEKGARSGGDDERGEGAKKHGISFAEIERRQGL